VFAKINGKPVTMAEYLHLLERQTVNLSGSGGVQPTNVERLVLDTLVGNRVTADEAAKVGVAPTDADVDAFYRLQKRLFEGQTPGKDYEQTLSDQGVTPDEIRYDLRAQLAESALYAKRLNVSDADLRAAYNDNQGRFGLPARVQMRAILVKAGGPEENEAAKLLAAKTDFAEVAAKLNPAPLRANGGLIPQTTPLAALPAEWVPQVEKTAEGGTFGPVEFPAQPGTKAWIRVERKYPAVAVPFEEALPLVRRQLVLEKLAAPENAAVRAAIVKLKFDAVFEPTDPAYGKVWAALKASARAAGVGQAAPAAAAPATAKP
jgi:hypothetical protein